MAIRSRCWFDEAHLLPAEEVVRSGAARVRISAAPGWWHGTLILTTARIMHLPDVAHPRADTIALWLDDVASADDCGHNRLTVISSARSLVFEIDGSCLDPATLAGRRGEAWVDDVRALRAAARSAPYRRRHLTAS